MVGGWLIDTYSPLGHEDSQLREEIPPSVVVLGVLAVKGHDVVVCAGHLLQVELHLFRLPPRILHRSLYNLTDTVLRMELLRIAEIAGIERALDVFDIVDVLLRVQLQLLHIDLLSRDDATNVLDEPFPLRVLVPDDPLHQVGESRLVLVVLDHSQPCKRAELEAVRLLVRIVHVVTDI